jgi:cytoplasmic iron level regulating protein YaaA (DUF328/UPF0246 family)
MLIVVSPAKTLDYESPLSTRKHTEPAFLAEASTLVAQLQKLGPDDLSELMHISDKLGELNHARFANWHTPFTLKNARQALFAFKGDVYLGLKAEQFSAPDLNFAQKHLRILSGLYGVLRPLDLMQAYRLEMGSSFKNSGGRNLYDFWGSKLTDFLNTELSAQAAKRRVVVNLASNEYFSAIKTQQLDAEVISPVFKDFASGQYRVLSFFAKKARGEMAAYLIRNRIKTPNSLRDFDVDGYRYSETDSSPNRPVFLRKQA